MQELKNHVKHFLLWLFIPVQKWFSRRGNQESKITKDAVDEIMNRAQGGDILLSFEFGRPTSLGIPGEWDHTAMINDVLDVVDAVGDLFIYKSYSLKDYILDFFRKNKKVKRINIGGVRKTPLEKWLYNMDGVALIRPITPNPDHNMMAAKRCNQFVGLGYDYIFTIGGEKIYCSELPYVSYIKDFPSFLWYHKGDEILPQYYRDMCDERPQHFQLIYEFKGEK